MNKSKIEWTENTWNPTTGCTKISEGCKNCYAYEMTKRLKAMGQEKYKNGFEITTHDYVVERPLSWKKPKRIFVNSMSDLFHKEVPVEFIKKVFGVMNEAHWHIFQVLTKRDKRLKKIAPKLSWSKNIWQGVTVENQNNIERIHVLSEINSKVKFVSFEPLLGPIDTNTIPFENLDWIIVGGESGNNARTIKKEWVINIRNACLENEVAFFFKQWGGKYRKKNGRSLEGKVWDQYPSEINRLEKSLKAYCS